MLTSCDISESLPQKRFLNIGIDEFLLIAYDQLSGYGDVTMDVHWGVATVDSDKLEVGELRMHLFFGIGGEDETEFVDR